MFLRGGQYYTEPSDNNNQCGSWHYDIAGKNIASENSLIQALKAACKNGE